jgi:hypothetical protein
MAPLNAYGMWHETLFLIRHAKSSWADTTLPDRATE